MTWRRANARWALVAVLGLLAGCGDGEAPTRPTPSSTTTETGSGDPSKGAGAESDESKETPDEARERVHATMMRNINRTLAERRQKIVRVHMLTFQTAIDSFRMVTKRLPETLEELAQTPEGFPHPFVDEIEPDPWKQPYAYRRIDRKRYEIRSRGPDGTEGTDDDIVWPEPTTGK